MPALDLRRLILLLTVAAALITFANSFQASYRTQRDLLMQQTLQANLTYAARQAYSTDNFLRSTQDQLAYSARLLADKLDQPAYLQGEVQRLKEQTNSFNSVFIVDARSQVLATAPGTLGLVGKTLNSTGAKALRDQRKTMISDPYVGSTGNLLVLIGAPITASDGRYLGHVTGSIYLQQKNMLATLLGSGYGNDGSYLYVVDRQGKLIYHPDTSRIGEQVLGNSAVRAVVAGAKGSQRLINLKGIDMLAGYSPLKTTGWGIITQTPTATPLAALNGLMLQTLKYTIPLLLLTLLAVWWLSRRIAQPLWHLANIVKNWSAPHALEKFGEVRAHYFEAEQLKQSIIEGLMLIQQQLGKLSRESLTDPLTGLDNRRGLRLAIDNLQSRQRPFSVITLDIDHFKQVNDQFGHDLGDQVLLHLAAQMRACTRNDDLLCRSGGEEFVILLPDMDLDSASALGERLRERMANSPSPIGTPVTISLGVAYASAGKHSPAQVLKLADQALYQAKKQGRNRLVAAQLAEFF